MYNETLYPQLLWHTSQAATTLYVPSQNTNPFQEQTVRENEKDFPPKKDTSIPLY